MGSLDGKVMLVTGGNAGIGLETAVALARDGAHVAITSRDATRGANALAEIRRRSGSEQVDVLGLDLASLASVRACAQEVLDRYDRLDSLVANAGGLLMERSTTEDGFETTFGVNHLGHFLLVQLLTERLRETAPARVVVVASHAHRFVPRGLDFDDLMSERHYRGFSVYGRSKLANLLFTDELARRLDGSGVTANAVHPGYVNSRFGRDGDTGGLDWFMALGGRLFAISPEEGARTSVHLAASPDVAGHSGGYWVRCRPAIPSRAARDVDAARRLWAVSEELVAR